VIIGGGPTGVEMAGAVAELTRHAAGMDFRYITRKRVRIVLIEAGERLLSTFPAELSEAARRALETLGVEVRLAARVTDVDIKGVTVGAETIAAATVIWAAGVQASPAGAWLDAPVDRVGRALVEPDLTVPGHPNVFVIGDTASVAGADGRPVPGVAPAAKQQGAYVARVIAARLNGAAAPEPFRYRKFGSLATIGRRRAVVDFGWLRLHGLLAWMIWSTAHIYFLVGFRNRFIVGTTWLWSYLTFERGARLITGLDSEAQVREEPPIKSAPARRRSEHTV
jgi:NADH dehydrogenase